MSRGKKCKNLGTKPKGCWTRGGARCLEVVGELSDRRNTTM